MSIVDQVLESRQAEQTAPCARYLEIIRRGDKPKKGDAAELEALFVKLGIGPDEARSDVAIVAECRRMEAAADAATGERLKVELSEAVNKLKVHLDETEAILAGRQPAEFSLRRVLTRVQQVFDRHTEAVAKLAEFSSLHWRLFCKPEPTKPAETEFSQTFPENPGVQPANGRRARQQWWGGP